VEDAPTIPVLHENAVELSAFNYDGRSDPMRSRAANWIPARVKRSNIEEAATSPSRWRRVAMKITSARTGILDT